MKRRNFLIGAAVAAGGLALGYRVWTDSFEAQAATLVTGDGGSLLGGWVKIATDDTVTVYVPHVDMGQGTHTALAMMLAEELDADWSKMRTERAPGEKAFANRFLAEGWILQGWRPPAFLDGAIDTAFGEAARFANLQITGGSTAVRFTGQAGLRIIGAAARSMLIEAAARRWRVNARELVAADSIVSHGASGGTARYGELASDAAALSVPSSPRLKPRQDYKIIGRSVPRLDIPAKVTGAMQYGIDILLPGMIYATVKAAPVHGGKLLSVDPAPAMKVKGVERVVSLDDAVAVVAQGYWPASRGLANLSPVFSDGGDAAVSSADLQARYGRAIAGKEGKSVHEAGDVDAAFKAAAPDRVVEATYHVPFLHHTAMEPINATAQFKDGRLMVWAGEQDALAAKASLVEWSGLRADDVTLIALPVGGSFGRRARPGEPLRQVMKLALQMAPRPVKMIWSREEDFAQGTYRPALASRIRAALDPQGRPMAWAQLFIDSSGRNDGFPIPYGIANQSMAAVASPHHVRTGSWRSVAHTQHGFYAESFIDELATAAGRDPFEYRRDLLPANSRHRRVLETAARKAEWGTPLAPGVGRGIALVESFGSIVAQIVEASIAEDGMPRVHRVTAAVDCGDVCHPDTATAQVEGAIIMGLSAALGEEITIADGAVVQQNFPAYPIMTLERTPPRIDVHFVPSDGPWGGLGEPGVPPVAPALANALFAVVGRRLRTLPLVSADRPLAAARRG